MRQILTLNAGSSSIKFALFDDVTGHLASAARPDRRPRRGDAAARGKARRAAIDRTLSQTRPRITPRRSHSCWSSCEQHFADFRSKASAIVSCTAASTSASRSSCSTSRNSRCWSGCSRSRRCTSRTILPACAPPRPLFRRPAGRLFRHRLSPRPPVRQRHLCAAARTLRSGHAPLRLSRPVLRICDRAASEIAPLYAAGRVVVTHLGNGASMCAIRDGQSVGSTMGFTALDGLPMGTRCGQLDPGVVLYLCKRRASRPANRGFAVPRSGLKGPSGYRTTCGSWRRRGRPKRSRPSSISSPGSAASSAPWPRSFPASTRSCSVAASARMPGASASVSAAASNGWASSSTRRATMPGEMIISSDRSRVRIFIIPTNEEMMIARHTARLLAAVEPAAVAA